MLLSCPKRHQVQRGNTTSCKEEKFSSEESSRDSNREDAKVSTNQEVVPNSYLPIGRDSLMLRSTGSASRGLKSTSTYIAEFAKNQLVETSTNWVGEDVMIILVQGVSFMTTCRTSRSCFFTTCCPWPHARFKLLLHAFILDRHLLFHVVSIRGCMIVH